MNQIVIRVMKTAGVYIAGKISENIFKAEPPSLNALIPHLDSHPLNSSSYGHPTETKQSNPMDIQPVKTVADMPTTQETIAELKRRLGKELYRMELDLQGGGRISGKPCDCLSAKHRLGLEATAEELMSYDKNPVYNGIVKWLNTHAPSFEPAEIAKHPETYYQMLAPEVRTFRKEVMGTEKLGSLLSQNEKNKAMNMVQKAMEKEME